MTTKEGGVVEAPRKKVGPKFKLQGGQRKQVFLDDASVAEAKRLGKGEVSAGIRIALQHTAESGFKQPSVGGRTFRAAYWTDGQSDVCLTTEEHSELPEHELLMEAARQARDSGLVIGAGQIMIGDYRIK
ncbi:hypothetical protein F2P45_29440 [Massilia sp. CCM 8733]|uniref:Uncharacterized protein n=1 Tax=Massilia mucilaginosa TaxID=2609282 RepID=A0ABX0P240_9BURK|nr:hypothetical protein [Massilia mucilaginosa]NHZ93103.1 hypothetical protein [Massilia mucilaginosa]